MKIPIPKFTLHANLPKQAGDQTDHVNDTNYLFTNHKITQFKLSKQSQHDENLKKVFC